MAEKAVKPVEPQSAAPIDPATLTPQDIAILSVEAEGWRPEVGSTLDGVILAIEIGTSEIDGKSRAYPIVIVLPTNGPRAVAIHAFHMTLMARFAASRPEPGDRLFLKFMGDMGREARIKGQSAPMLYALHVTKANPDTAKSPWDILGT